MVSVTVGAVVGPDNLYRIYAVSAGEHEIKLVPVLAPRTPPGNFMLWLCCKELVRNAQLKACAELQ